MTGPILVVDDEPLVRKMLARAVERTGAEVVTAADGEEGLTKFQELDSAVVFTDLRMPGMDGMAFLRSIKALAPDTPVVMFSAYTSDEMVEAARAAGAAHVLPKPFTHAELQQVLAIVRQSRAEVVAPPPNLAAPAPLTVPPAPSGPSRGLPAPGPITSSLRDLVLVDVG